MNAQEQWKAHYIKFRALRSARDKRVEKTNMHRFTREAALERKLEAAQRRIAQLENDINTLFEPDDPPSEPYSEMDLLQREAAGLP